MLGAALRVVTALLHARDLCYVLQFDGCKSLSRHPAVHLIASGVRPHPMLLVLACLTLCTLCLLPLAV